MDKDSAIHYAHKVINRLEQFSKRCGAAYIHDVHVHIAVLGQYITFVDKPTPRLSAEEKLVDLRQAIQDAECFLVRAGREMTH